VLFFTLLCLASTAAIGYYWYIWIGLATLILLYFAVMCVMFLCFFVFVCCKSLQQGWADTTIKQTWVWAVEENEDFRETLEDVVAQAQQMTREETGTSNAKTLDPSSSRFSFVTLPSLSLTTHNIHSYTHYIHIFTKIIFILVMVERTEKCMSLCVTSTSFLC